MASPINFLKRVNLSPDGVIQVGANTGQEVQAYFDGGISHGIFIEPLDGPFAMLKTKTDPHPGFRAVQALCADEDGRTFKFHVASNDGQSSSVFQPDQHLKLHPGVVFEDTREITSVTLDSLMDSLRKETPDKPFPVYDLLCMDTQGCELLVLKGARKTLETVSAVWTEVSWTELYKGGVLLDELTAYMNEMGFIMVGLSMNRNLWGDALFIRRNSKA